MNISKQQKNKRGFVLLFAALVSSIILLVSVGIFNSVQKEVILSSYARESQRAFYAADSALECALYADIKGVVISDPDPLTGLGGGNLVTPFTVNPTGDQAHTFSCGGQDIDSIYLEDSGGTQNYIHPYVFRYANGYNTDDISCAYILVEKELRTGGLAGKTEVRITAVGFNVCTDDGSGSGPINIPDFDDPTLLERRLSITYTR